MKKVLLLLASAALLFAGCAKEQIAGPADNGETVNVSVVAQLLNEEQIKASWDNDGNGAKVDHWIMEVYDAQGKLFDRQEKTGQSGLTNTFSVILIKNQSYKFAFWADKQGSYDTAKLTEVKAVSAVAGLDSRDAFFAEKDYTSTASETITAKLYRPFAQINIVTLDLKKIYDQMSAAGTTSEYGKFEPKDLKLSCKTYNQFNVLDGTVSELQDTDLTLASCYADFSAHAAKTTIFMDYLFADEEKELKDLAFTFKSNEVAIDYNFANIPLQRNYRTNISGNLLSNDAVVNVEIIPIWEEPEYEEEVWSAGMITPVTPEDDVYTINLPSELAWIAQQVNKNETFAGKTVKLAKDIDLNNGEWTPAGGVSSYPSTAFCGTFDGQNYKILNLNCSDKTKNYASAALFGAVKNATIKNVTIENVKVSSTHYAAALVGYVAEGIITVENCAVKTGTITSTPEWLGTEYDNGDKVGGILGYGANACKISGCAVEGLDIKAYRDLGGIAGAVKCAEIKNNIVKNCTITADQTVNSYGKKDFNAGAIVGRSLEGAVDESNTAENVIISPYITDASGNYHVATKSGLFTIASEINSALSSFYGKTIFIEKDIDLENEDWTPIQGSPSGDYTITVDGQGHKISNVKVSEIPEDGGAGFFGHWAGTITNLELDGVRIEDTINWSGALCGYFSTGTISNVTVSNVSITNLNETKCKRIGGLCGFVDDDTDFSNVALNGVAITGTEQLGGFIGSLQNQNSTYNFTNCSISDVSIYKVGAKEVNSFGSKVGGRAAGAVINGDITVSGTNTLPDGAPEDGWGTVGL